MTKSIMQILLAALIAFFATAESQAQQTPEARGKRPALISIPTGLTLTPTDSRGRRTVFRPSQDYQIFDVADWKATGHALEDYVWLWHYSGDLELKVGLLEQSAANLETQKAALETNATSLRDGLKAMSGLVDREQKTALKKARRASVELWLWRSATVVALVATAFAGGAYAVEKGK